MPWPDAMRDPGASRHLPIAQALSGEDVEAVISKFRDQRVLLTGDPCRLQTRKGQLMVKAAANLVSRFCHAVDISFDGRLERAEEVQELILGIDPSADSRVVSGAPREGYAAVLSVGNPPRAADHLVAIEAAGWLAASSDRGNVPFIRDVDDGNPFGAMAAAALGAAEVFKLLVRPHPERAIPYGDTTFSTFSYAVGGRQAGPELLGALALPPSLLAGVGGVGNAFLMALREVPGVEGELAAVDRELLDDVSNLNRYALARREDVRFEDPLPKTALAKRLFAGTSVTIRELRGDVRHAVAAFGRGGTPEPLVVLCALDNNLSRHELQDFWPDLLLEGATGGTVLQVSRCARQEALACLRCLHPLDECPRRSYEERLRQGLASAEAERDSLRPQAGPGACGVLSEVERISTLALANRPVEPAVSFVSMMSGVLMAAEYVKHASGTPSPLKTIFQADLMFPLESMLLTVRPRTDCSCVRRRNGSVPPRDGGLEAV